MSEARGTILVVDDDRQTRLKLTRSLEALGHKVKAVDGGEAALEILGTESCDIILLDILMPGMDGFEVLRKLKKDTRLSNIPVIVVSALEDEQNEERSKQLGAQAYLTKPVEADILNARLAECLYQAK